MAIIKEKYKFSVKTRRLIPTNTYAETEFKRTRIFVEGISENMKIYAELNARMKGGDTFGYLNYRYGDVAPSADCITLHTPINKLLTGEWLQAQITGEVSENARYAGIEAQGEKRWDNSTMILTAKKDNSTSGAW